MLHEHYSALLQLYIDGEISPLETILIEEHLPSCRSCRIELNQLKLLDWDLNRQPTVEIPQELAEIRVMVVKNHLAAARAAQKEFAAKDFWRLQVNIYQHTSSFIALNPVNRALKNAAGKTASFLGKAAVTGLKRRNPLFGRFIPGQV